MSTIYAPQYYDMSSFAKEVGCIDILNFEYDLDIDWLVHKIIIHSPFLENLRIYSLGTNNFLDSVTEATIDYFLAQNKSDVEKDTKLIHEYFKNLSNVNYRNLYDLSISEVIKIYIDHKSDKIVSTRNCNDGYQNFEVLSNVGHALLYDDKNKYLVKFSKFNLVSDLYDYTTQGEYVIFHYESSNLQLSFEGIEDDYQEYRDVDFGDIKYPAIILHKKYLEELRIYGGLTEQIDFVPTKYLYLYVYRCST